MLPNSHHLLSLDFHHLADGGKFVLQLGLQLASALPSLLASMSWLSITLALCDMPSTSISSHLGHGTS